MNRQTASVSIGVALVISAAWPFFRLVQDGHWLYACELAVMVAVYVSICYRVYQNPDLPTPSAAQMAHMGYRTAVFLAVFHLILVGLSWALLALRAVFGDQTVAARTLFEWRGRHWFWWGSWGLLLLLFVGAARFLRQLFKPALAPHLAAGGEDPAQGKPQRLSSIRRLIAPAALAVTLVVLPLYCATVGLYRLHSEATTFDRLRDQFADIAARCQKAVAQSTYGIESDSAGKPASVRASPGTVLVLEETQFEDGNPAPFVPYIGGGIRNYASPDKPEEIRMIVAITRRELAVRRYVGSGPDLQWAFDVKVLAWPDAALVAAKSFLGSVPGDRSGGPAPGPTVHGSEPWWEVSEWVQQFVAR